MLFLISFVLMLAPSAHADEEFPTNYREWRTFIDKQEMIKEHAEWEREEKQVKADREKALKETAKRKAEIGQELERRARNKIPYSRSEERFEQMKKIRGLKLAELKEEVKILRNNLRLKRAWACATTATSIPLVAVLDATFFSRAVSHLAADTEKTYVAPEWIDPSRPDAALSTGSMHDEIGDWFGGLFGMINFSFFSTAAWDSTDAYVTAAFRPRISNSKCAKLTTDLADIRDELKKRSESQLAASQEKHISTANVKGTHADAGASSSTPSVQALGSAAR